MGFGKLILVESILMLSAGLIFYGGIRGILASTVVVSIMNFLRPSQDFLAWEISLLIGTGVGIFLLYIVNRKAGKTGVVNGLAGNLLSLVLFAAFVTPILALIIWLLVFGTGVIPRIKGKQIVWSVTPTVVRILLGACFIIYGNFLYT